MSRICATFGRPTMSGCPVTSYLSVSSQAGPPAICRAWSSYANVMRSLSEVLSVRTWRPLTV